MKNLITIFFQKISLFQKLNIHFPAEDARKVTRSLKFLFVLPLLLSSLFTVQALALFDDGTLNNDICPSEEYLTISDGTNPFDGVIGFQSDDIDYYQIIVPADGNITIKWETAQSGKEASLLVGTSCDDDSIYDGPDADDTHTTDTFDVSETDIIYIKIYNGEGKGYRLTIDYDIDISDVTIVEPVFCYEYNYDQNDLNLSKANPGYISDTVSLSPDVHINLGLRLLDNNYSSVKNVVVDIIDINGTQAHYASESVWLKKPGRFFNEKIDDADLSVSDTYINDIQVGTMIKSDYTAIDYEITPQITNLHFPLNAQISYDLPVPTLSGSIATVSSSQSILGDNIPICPEPGSGYSPAYSIFNVEDNHLNDQSPAKYNLLTQTADRVDDLEIVSYTINDPNQKNAVSSFVGIEMIDLNDVSGFPDACSNPNNAISPRVWIPFLDTNAAEDEDSNVTQVSFNRQTLLDAIANGTSSDQILNISGTLSTPEDFYSIANENTAFRILYSAVGDDEGLLQIVHTKQGLRIDNFSDLVKGHAQCKQPVKNPQNNQITESVPVACSNDGNNLTYQEIATCMECLYGYDTRFLCSRDNFAIRPESFRVSLSDQDQNSPATQSHIKTNYNTTLTKIAAGYQYALEINATNHQDDSATPGYNPSFPLDGADGNRSFRLKQSFTIDTTKCNDIEDRNKTSTFINGQIDQNLSSAQVGEYNLTIIDKLWTRVDWDDTLMGHHTGNHFSAGDDCDFTTSYVPDDTNTTAMNGCIITSDNHTNNDASAQYTDIPLRVHPYKFDLNGSNPINPMIGPYTRTNGQTFVYIDTPPSFDVNNTNMSYNLNGTFFAAGYDDIGSLSNFVTGCYADNLNMNLTFTYNSPEPPLNKTPFLSYSLKDHNTTNETDIYRPVLGYDFEVGDHNSSTAPFIIDQNETFFVKPMLGAITMDLGYNFKRDYNNTLNPRYIEFHDFNITYKTNPTNIKADLTDDHKIFGDKELDHNVTFVYGRAKPSQNFYDDVRGTSINTPISIVVYCDQDPITCSAVYNIETVLSKTDEYDWYLSRGHIMTPDNDGNITLNATNGGTVTSPVVINNSGGIDTNVVVGDGGQAHPLDVNITFGGATNRWIIYNKDKNEIPIPFYRVRFINESDWAGTGDTGHAVGGKANIQKINRSGW